MAELSERELVDAIRVLEEEKCRASARQAQLSRELATRRGRDAAALVAFARRESPTRGVRLLGLAHALAELPHTEAALHDGALSEWRATIIARETACLSREDRAEVDRLISSVRSFDGWGDRRLAAEVRGLVAQLDPQAVVDRHARAEADRRVSLRPAPDTMAQLSCAAARRPGCRGVGDPQSGGRRGTRCR